MALFMKNALTVQRIRVGDFGVNTYIVICAETQKGVLIDPAGENGKILSAIKTTGAHIMHILNTHGHADHVAGNGGLKKALAVPVCMHEADDDFFSDPSIREQSEKELGLPPADPADIRLMDDDTIEAGNMSIKVIHTPGHTPGSVCFLAGNNLFTGDTLFVGSAGRTDLSGGSLDALLESLEKKIIVLPGETIVWPGHDYGDTPASTIEREIRENIYIADFILADA